MSPPRTTRRATRGDSRTLSGGLRQRRAFRSEGHLLDGRLHRIRRRLREAKDDLRRLAEIGHRRLDRDLGRISDFRTDSVARRAVPREGRSPPSVPMTFWKNSGPPTRALPGRAPAPHGDELRVHDRERRVQAEDGRAPLELHLVRARLLVECHRPFERRHDVIHGNVRSGPPVPRAKTRRRLVGTGKDRRHVLSPRAVEASERAAARQRGPGRRERIGTRRLTRRLWRSAGWSPRPCRSVIIAVTIGGVPVSTGHSAIEEHAEHGRCS